jgi:hypothetical protein
MSQTWLDYERRQIRNVRGESGYFPKARFIGNGSKSVPLVANIRQINDVNSVGVGLE